MDDSLPSRLLNELEDLRTDPSSEWEGCLKNQSNDLLPYLTKDGETAIAPLRFVAHVRATGDRYNRGSHTGSSLRSITSALSEAGYRLINARDADGDFFEDVYRPYFLGLNAGGESRISVREEKYLAGDMTCWLANREAVSHEVVLNAMETFSEKGQPNGFSAPNAWFVAHPSDERIFPLKMIWGLATEQRGRDFWNNASLRRKFEMMGFQCAELTEEDVSSDTQDRDHIEGEEKMILRRERERNPVARKLCIALYAQRNGGRVQCLACGFDFERAYGSLGRGFIHVHHLGPLAEATGPRQVDPNSDLIPLCPNCHAIVHRRRPMLTLAELVDLLES